MSEEDIMSPRVAKVIETLKTIRKAYAGDKVLVFSRCWKILDVIERAIVEFELPDIRRVHRFDGTVDPALREGVKSAFAQSQGFAVMLVTAGCGGAGLNLASASHVILREPWRRMTDERQAIARAYRQGQEHEVHAWRLSCIDALIDRAVRTMQTKISVVPDQIMKTLCRPDNEAPVIPEQYAWGGSGEYH